MYVQASVTTTGAAPFFMSGRHDVKAPRQSRARRLQPSDFVAIGRALVDSFGGADGVPYGQNCMVYLLGSDGFSGRVYEARSFRLERLDSKGVAQ